MIRHSEDKRHDNANCSDYLLRSSTKVCEKKVLSAPDNRRLRFGINVLSVPDNLTLLKKASVQARLDYSKSISSSRRVRGTKSSALNKTDTHRSTCFKSVGIRLDLERVSEQGVADLCLVL